MPISKQLAIALAGDYKYIRQIETTLKSLCVHNKSLKVYILNQDIPKEWFQFVQRQMAKIGCELVDLKLMDTRLDKQWTAGFSHINYMAFARYFIPELINDEVVLYLDSDLVVTGEITHLFEINLGENYVAAVEALHGKMKQFNSGVLLIHNKKWKEDKLFARLLETTQREWQNVPEGDQSILNMVLAGKWLRLNGTYNFPIGYDLGASLKHQIDVFDIPIDPLPVVLHYISHDKPWNTFSSGRLRQIWWRYHWLEWSTIVEKMRVPECQYIQMAETTKQILTMTNSQDLEAIEQLIIALPQYQFHIGAYTNMGRPLLKLGQYNNVILHPKIMYQSVLQLISEVDIYLDVNYGEKFPDVIERAKDCHKPILAFDTTKNHIHVDDIFYNAEQLIVYLEDNI